MSALSRRKLLKGASALTFTAGLGALGAKLNAASAAETSGYKALVCIFLLGGMDHADTVLPADDASWQALRAHRSGLFSLYSSRSPDTLLRLDADNIGSFDGRGFGLPQSLAPLHRLFMSGEAAIVGGVGPLIEPTTRAMIENDSSRLPGRLLSHNDQQSTWMSMNVEGALSGWGGRFMDTITAQSSQNPIFGAITTAGNDTFLTSANTRQFRLSAKGVPRVEAVDRDDFLGSGADRDAAREKLREYLEAHSPASQNLFDQDYTAAIRRWYANSQDYTAAAAAAQNLPVVFPDTGLGGKLQAVAQTIALRDELGVSRQIFYATLGGFDTHSDQVGDLPSLHFQLAEAVEAFRNAMVELGVWEDVAVFTASDFGRAVVGNGDGTDHGWGGHHFVAGGSVAGRRIYGEMTGYDIEGGDRASYYSRRGILIPKFSVDQYAATLGGWFGLEPNELDAALPGLANFDVKTMGFLNA